MSDRSIPNEAMKEIPTEGRVSVGRGTSESARTTLFQLEALVSALNHGSFEKAASELGHGDKYRLIKAVRRLAENMQFEGLSERIRDELVIPSQMRGLQPSASRVLGALSDFQRAAEALRTKTAVISCIAYPSMVTIFLADAVACFESQPQTKREVRFIDLESTNRRQAGNAMLRYLMSGLVDVAVAPTRTLSDETRSVDSEELYKWRLVAAIHEGHPLRNNVFRIDDDPCIEVGEVANYPLLVSPPQHKSRDLLQQHEPIEGFTIELESLNSQARAALGRSGRRVPIIASDALTDGEFDPEWPAVVVRDSADGVHFLGDSHSIYWRRDLPREIAAEIKAFAQCVYHEAAALRNRPGGDTSGPALLEWTDITE